MTLSKNAWKDGAPADLKKSPIGPLMDVVSRNNGANFDRTTEQIEALDELAGLLKDAPRKTRNATDEFTRACADWTAEVAKRKKALSKAYMDLAGEKMEDFCETLATGIQREVGNVVKKAEATVAKEEKKDAGERNEKTLTALKKELDTQTASLDRIVDSNFQKELQQGCDVYKTVKSRTGIVMIPNMPAKDKLNRLKPDLAKVVEKIDELLEEMEKASR